MEPPAPSTKTDRADSPCPLPPRSCLVVKPGSKRCSSASVREARAGVSDDDLDRLVRSTTRGDAEPAAVLHGIARIEHQVEHDAFDAQLGDGHVGALRIGLQVHLDAVRQQRVEQPAHGVDGAVEVDRHERPRGVGAVQLVHEIEDGRGHDHAMGDILAGRVLGRQTAQRQLGVAAHRGEQVAHVVTDRAQRLGVRVPWT